FVKMQIIPRSLTSASLKSVVPSPSPVPVISPSASYCLSFSAGIQNLSPISLIVMFSFLPCRSRQSSSAFLFPSHTSADKKRSTGREASASLLYFHFRFSFFCCPMLIFYAPSYSSSIYLNSSRKRDRKSTRLNSSHV